MDDWLVALLVLLGTVAVWWLVFCCLAWLVARTTTTWDDMLIAEIRIPTLVITTSTVVLYILPSWQAGLGDPATERLRHAAGILLTAGVYWLIVRLLRVGEEYLHERYDWKGAANNLQRRVKDTRVVVFRQCISVVVVFVGTVSILLTFPKVHDVAVTLLMYSGVLALAVGLAARPVLENMIASLQVAITQPLRLDDVVIINGEWGRVEEITLTFVVVAIWDQRRLVVPYTFLIGQPFQNWTRKTSDLLGTVFIWVDPAADVDAMRDKVNDLCKANKLWDGRLAMVAVTNVSEDSMEVRILVSAADAGNAWDLRCFVREGVMRFLAEEHPSWLSRRRVQARDATSDTDHPLCSSPQLARSGSVNTSTVVSAAAPPHELRHRRVSSFTGPRHTLTEFLSSQRDVASSSSASVSTLAPVPSLSRGRQHADSVDAATPSTYLQLQDAALQPVAKTSEYKDA